MMQKPIATILGVIAFALFVQMFLRYQYIKDTDGLRRIDRITGKSCIMPCEPSKWVKQRTEDELRQDAISSAESSKEASEIVPTQDAAKFKWSTRTIRNHGDYSDFVFSHPQYGLVADFQSVIVCFCSKTRFGYHWVYDVPSKNITYIDKNSDLMMKYGLK